MADRLHGQGGPLGGLHPLSRRWPVCLTNNAAERALRGVALGRKSWLFAGSERGGDRAAFMYSLIVTARLNDIDPQAWLADVLGRLPDMTASQVPDLLPWNWKATSIAKPPARGLRRMLTYDCRGSYEDRTPSAHRSSANHGG